MHVIDCVPLLQGTGHDLVGDMQIPRNFSMSDLMGTDLMDPAHHQPLDAELDLGGLDAVPEASEAPSPQRQAQQQGGTRQQKQR